MPWPFPWMALSPAGSGMGPPKDSGYLNFNKYCASLQQSRIEVTLNHSHSKSRESRLLGIKLIHEVVSCS